MNFFGLIKKEDEKYEEEELFTVLCLWNKIS